MCGRKFCSKVKEQQMKNIKCIRDPLTSPSNVRVYVGDVITIIKVAKKLEARGLKVKIDVDAKKKNSRTFLFVWTRRQEESGAGVYVGHRNWSGSYKRSCR